jgi:hypothetical protein
MNKATLLIFVFMMALAFSCTKKNENVKVTLNSDSQNKEYISPEDIVKANSLPSISKWMYSSEKKKADWLGAKLNNKSFREPINIIIVDSISKSAGEAENNLVNNFDRAGFKMRVGHSNGYLGYIENNFYKQVPGKNGQTFSDAPFEISNCHGRIFGPCEINGVYYFSGALSKEKVVVSIPIHRYDSFNIARDKLANNLNSKTNYKTISYVEMLNSLSSDSLTTGDHDGKAILISVVK